jgi:hypothetical protein
VGRLQLPDYGGCAIFFNNRKPYISYKLSVAGLKRPLKPGQTILVQARQYRDGAKAD